jgi:L-amino acid N-acyltransferase YncA
MTIRIRDSVPEDVPAITAIYRHSVLHGTASFEIDPPDETEIARRRAAILAGGYPHLVADIDGAVAGYCYVGPYRPRPAYRFTVEDSIYVAPDRQGTGIGRAMLPALIARCEAAKYRIIVAVIGDTANAGSIGLHRAFGFTHAGTLPAAGWKFGRWLDSVMMVRPLGPGATTPPEEGQGRCPLQAGTVVTV